jgi:hypothetical protein
MLQASADARSALLVQIDRCCGCCCSRWCCSNWSWSSTRCSGCWCW